MHYEVRFVSDHSLPEGVEWAFARQAGETILFVRQSAIDATTGRCGALDAAWSAWEARRPPSPVPTTRRNSDRAGWLALARHAG